MGRAVNQMGLAGCSLATAAAVLLAGLIPLDGELMARRVYYHFMANNMFDPARQPVVVPSLPYRLTSQDMADVLTMVDQDGNVRSATASNAATATRFLRYVPGFSWLLGGTVNGTVAYASFIEAYNPAGAAAMRRVRDRVLSNLNNASVGLPFLYPVDDRSQWAAFSVTSQPSRSGSFQWHYDAESKDEYRALYVARGGD